MWSTAARWSSVSATTAVRGGAGARGDLATDGPLDGRHAPRPDAASVTGTVDAWSRSRIRRRETMPTWSASSSSKASRSRAASSASWSAGKWMVSMAARDGHPVVPDRAGQIVGIRLQGVDGGPDRAPQGARPDALGQPIYRQQAIPGACRPRAPSGSKSGFWSDA